MRLLSAAVMACLLPACTSDLESVDAVMNNAGNLGPAGSQAEDHAVCPSALAGAAGSACDVEGLFCYPEYACGIAPAIATCQCTGGEFACVDALGASLSADAAPKCPASLPTPACPATMALANRTACTEAGQICTYSSPCPGSIPAFLDCQCLASAGTDGGGYLSYFCGDICSGVGTEDGGATPSEDAEADASAQSASTHDAAADVAAEASSKAPGDASAD